MSNTFKLIGYLSILVLAGILTLIILLLPAETSFPLFLIICAVSLVIGLIAPVVEPRIRRFTHPIVRYLAASSTLNNILKLFALVVKPLEGPVDAISKLGNRLVDRVKNSIRAVLVPIRGVVNFLNPSVTTVKRVSEHALGGLLQPASKVAARLGRLFGETFHTAKYALSWFVRIILQDGRNRNFVAATALLLIANYLLFSGPSALPLVSDSVAQFEARLHIELYNMDNIVLGSVLLLVSAYCAIRALSPAPVKSQTVSQNLNNPPFLLFIYRHLIPLLAIVIMFALIVSRLSQRDASTFPITIWLICLLLLGWLGFRYDRKAGVVLSPRINRQDLVLLLVIGALGFIVGLYQLDTVPNRIAPDEEAFLTRGLSIADGQEIYSFFDNGPFTFPLAGSFYQGTVLRMLGETLWAWRFASLLIAMLGVIPTYLLTREIFSRRLAAIAGLVMVTMPHFLAYARAGYNNAQAILPVALAMYLLYLALQRKSTFFMVLSGISAGFGFYTYAAGKLGVVVGILLLLLYSIPAVLMATSRYQILHKISDRLFLSAAFCIGVAATVLPIITYQSVVDPGGLRYKFLENFFANSANALVLRPDESEIYRYYPPIHIDNQTFFINPNLYAILLARGFIRTMLAFNIQLAPFNELFIGGPLPGSIGALFYVIGLALLLARIRSKGYALVVFWFFVGIMMLSVINSDPPRDTHMVAIVPVEAILVAVGLDAVMRFLFERPFRFNRAAGMAVAGTMLLSVMLTGLRDYFVSMPQYYPPDIRSVIDFYDLQLQTPRDVVYVTNDPNQYDFAPFLTLYLANKAHFRLVRLDAIASTGVLPSGQDTTWFFEPTVAKEVINYLTVTLHQNNIQPKVYRYINGSAFLISYEFQSSSHS